MVSGYQNSLRAALPTLTQSKNHLDPATVAFAENAIEVCDATIRYVEEHLDEVGDALLPGGVWCPWGSRLLEEVSPSPILTPALYLPIILGDPAP